MSAAQGQLWGAWVLGDLTHTVQRATELIGPSQDVALVSAVPPGAAGAPGVFVLVPDRAALGRVKEAVLGNEYIVDFRAQESDHWAARVAGMELVVALEKESSA